MAAVRRRVVYDKAEASARVVFHVVDYDSAAVPFFFFFNDTAPTEIYTLSLHDALPISQLLPCQPDPTPERTRRPGVIRRDRKSTRLNSSHVEISYAVFCLKKKKKKQAAEGAENKTVAGVVGRRQHSRGGDGMAAIACAP